MGWEPLISGVDAARARRVLDVTIEGLETGAVDSTDVDVLADRVLTCAYLGGDAAAAFARLATRLGSGARPSLFGGTARIGWTFAHLADGDDVDANARVIDEVLGRRDELGAHGFDLISGTVGIGVYALERGEIAGELLTRVVEELQHRAEPRSGGCTWRTQEKDAAWDLGVAHGVAGVIGFLSRALAFGCDAARPLLDGAVAYLLAHASSTPHACGWFPSTESAPVHPRVAWCYGDLGTALSLVAAGLYANNQAWREQGLTIALDCARRGTSDARDACVCHGAAGNAHIFNRLAQATRSSVLADAARNWLTRALDFADSGFVPRVNQGSPRTSTMLYGAPGVALVLHAALSRDEPLWDRLLLADLPIIE